MQTLHANHVWDLVELPKGRKAIGSKWVFKLKTGADGSVEDTRLDLWPKDAHRNLDLIMMKVVRFESI